MNQSSIKNLDLLKWNLKDVIIVDNDPKAYSWHQKNGLPISPWCDNRNDQDLRLISKLLVFLSKVDDVRNYIPNFVANSTICLENIDNVIHKYEIERDSESSSFSKLSKINQEHNKNLKKAKKQKKLKNSSISEYFAPDEFINAFNSGHTNIKKINEIKAFEVKKPSFSNYDMISTDSENENVIRGHRSFIEPKNLLIENKKVKVTFDINGNTRNTKLFNPSKQRIRSNKTIYSNTNFGIPSSSSCSPNKMEQNEDLGILMEEDPSDFLYFE